MSKTGFSIGLFVTAFVIVYGLLCLVYPGGKMALDATALDYFRVAVTHMALLKSIISLTVSLVIGAIPTFAGKKRS